MARSVRRFSAVLRRAGINAYVELPPRLSASWGRAPSRAVRLRVGRPGRALRPLGPKGRRDEARLLRIGRLTRDGWFRTTLVPSRGGPLRLFLDGWMRDAAEAAIGDAVEVHLRPDGEQRTLRAPKALLDALACDSSARRRWDALAASRRKEMVSYLNVLTSPEAVERTVRKILAELRGALRRAQAMPTGPLRGRDGERGPGRCGRVYAAPQRLRGGPPS